MVEQLTSHLSVTLHGLRARVSDEAGVTAVEYGLMAAVIGVVFLAAGAVLLGGFGGFRSLILGGFSS